MVTSMRCPQFQADVPPPVAAGHRLRRTPSGATVGGYVLAGLVRCRRTGPILRRLAKATFRWRKWRYGCAVGLGSTGISGLYRSFVQQRSICAG